MDDKITCESCGHQFDVELMQIAGEDDNWFCNQCIWEGNYISLYTN